MTITRKTPLALLLASAAALRRVAIVTGGTRGVGLGISQALAENDFDLLLTYNSDSAAAEKAVLELKNQFPICAIETVGGDVSLPETRKAIFDKFDSAYAKTHCLGAVVHNAGQYVGVSSTNAAGIKATGPPPGFGDGSLLGADGGVDFTQMHYYQRMYGDAFVDLCERGLARFPEDGGSLVGISSPGCTLQFNPNLGYDMPGSGKRAPASWRLPLVPLDAIAATHTKRRCVMEYTMRLFAVRAAAKKVNANVVIPGVTPEGAWEALGATRGMSGKEMAEGVASRLAPMGPTPAKVVGDGVAFLCSPAGRAVTGVSLPVDNGVHLKA